MIILGNGSGISFQILEVWDETYGQMDGYYNEYLEDYTVDQNFGGIAEVYLYGEQYSQGNYDPIDTKIVPFTLPEDSVRFNDPKTQEAIDGGAYWADEENQYTRRGMNGGSYQATISVTHADTSVGGLRFNADYGVSFNTISTDFTSKTIAYWKEYVARQQELQMMFMLIIITAAIILAALTAGVGAIIGSAILAALTSYSFIGWGAVMIGIHAGLVTGAFIGGVIMTTRIVGLFNPELAGFMGSVLLQFEDILAGAIVHAFCEIMDGYGSAIVNQNRSFFGKKRQIESHWWREHIQPLAYTAYAWFLDTNGTVGRLAGAYYLEAFMGATQEEIDYLVYDDYEKAMFRGKAYNFVALDPSHYWS